MNAHQQTAIDHHCRLATECLHPRFIWITGGVSIALTVNSGYE